MKFNKKKLTKKVKSVIKQDLFVSLAMVSIMINIFFFSGVLLFTSTSAIDEELFTASRSNLCEENYATNMRKAMEESNDPAKARALFEIKCNSGEFSRYFDNAVEAYLNDTL